MNRTSTVFCLCLVLIALAAGRARAEESEAGPDSKSLWVTSIAQLGTTDQFVAATADGLLLREAAVYSFGADNPNSLTKMYSHPAAVWCVATTS
ncbi:MAG: hypothetical protein JJ992_20960, partial [Planctomycetes bacterium]|nr:hypothetical protein [Planctomycetota bacterium]